MTLKEWIEEKYKSIDTGIDEIIKRYKKENIDIKSANTHPQYISLFMVMNNPIDLASRDMTNGNDYYVVFDLYRQLITKINIYDVFIPSVENFAMFIGWNTATYQMQLRNSTSDIELVLSMVDDYIIENQLSSGQNGTTKASVTKFRTQISGEHGHSLVTQKEANTQNRYTRKEKSKQELLEELKNMGTTNLLSTKGKKEVKK